MQDVVVDEGVLRPLPDRRRALHWPERVADFGRHQLARNLKRSGFFDPLNPASFVETGLTLANAPNFPQWTSIGAQAVLYGRVTPRADGRIDVGFRLYGPYRQCQLVSYQFTATSEQWRRITARSRTWSISA